MVGLGLRTSRSTFTLVTWSRVWDLSLQVSRELKFKALGLEITSLHQGLSITTDSSQTVISIEYLCSATQRASLIKGILQFN